MVPDRTSDAQLLSRVASGDAEAFSALFQRRQRDVYRFALHMTASPSIAEDVTQETFLAVMRDADRYDPARATVAAWLCGIARNHVRRHVERDRRLQAVAGCGDDDSAPGDERLSEDADPLEDLTRTERIEELRDAILTLPIRYREVVVLCDLHELSYLEAASAVGCAVGTVRSRLHRGRALLAVKLTTAPVSRTESPVVSGCRRTPTAHRDRSETAIETRSAGGPIGFSRRARSARNLA